MTKSIISLVLFSLLPVAASVGFSLLDKKKPKRTHGEEVIRQIVIGAVFGVIAVLGTECGIPINGATVNCRDSAVLCAGLIFGGPSGVIAGLIAGIERFLSESAGDFTRIACTFATIFAGFFGFFCRKWLFDNKRPIWPLALTTGLFCEVFHLSLIFITNMDASEHAMEVVKVCTPTMIPANALSVLAAVMAVTLLEGGSLRFVRGVHTPLSTTVQRWLLVCVVLAFFASTTFIYDLQDKIAIKDSETVMAQSIADVSADIIRASDAHLIELAHTIASETDTHEPTELMHKYNVQEINISDRNGIIVKTTNPNYEQFDMKTGEQSAEFICLLHGTKEYAQAYGPISYNSQVSMKYVGVSYGDGFVQIGLDADGFQKDIDYQVSFAASNRHIGRDGLVVILDNNGTVVSGPQEYIGASFLNSQLDYTISNNEQGRLFRTTLDDKDVYCMYDRAEGYIIVALRSYDEAVHMRDVSIYVVDFLMVMTFGALFVLVYIFINKRVVKNVIVINSDLMAITQGNLNTMVNVNTNEEFTILSDGINTTVNAMKGYIKEAEERIAAELELARSIQRSALPATFPAYPQRRDFDVYALMQPAKEVGGDFYDFYFTGSDIFNFLIADVSGKGIPASLFMMRAKTQLKSLSETGISLADVFTRGNNGLCEGNDAGMFVTAWEGSLDLKSGIVRFVNAGHNPPLIRHAGGSFEYLRTRSGLVLAGMEDVSYRLQELELMPGDIVFLYTDGVTEATNASKELFGEERLLEALNKCNSTDMKEICDFVNGKVAEFVGTAPQFDDITMLAVIYKGV